VLYFKVTPQHLHGGRIRSAWTLGENTCRTSRDSNSRPPVSSKSACCSAWIFGGYGLCIGRTLFNPSWWKNNRFKIKEFYFLRMAMDYLTALLQRRIKYTRFLSSSD